jgi:uncharacterized membrane protein
MVVLALAILLAVLALPFVSLWRTFALGRQIAALEARLRAVESAGRQPRPASDAAGATKAPAAAQPPAPFRSTAPEPARTGSLPPSAPPSRDSQPSITDPVRPLVTRPATTRASSDDLEAILGGRWMLYAGLLVLLLGVAFFLKYAFDQAWINPQTRCAIGALAGIALIPSGLRLASRGYERYGHLLAGAGIVILYLTTYAALNLYALIPPPAAAAVLVLVTATGALLSDHRRSLAFAVLAAVGGYATPLLVGGSRDAQVTLFSYIALLTAAMIYLARRRGWPQLSATAYVLTVAILLIWADRFYVAEKYLRTELFLTLYCGVFLWALAGIRRATHPFLGPLVATAPLLYYAASLVILWDFRLELFVFLILFSGAALALSVASGLDSLRLAAWAAAALPFLGRIEHTAPAWTTAMLATGAAIVGLHLAAQVHRLGKGTPVPASDVLLLHGNGVFACVAAYAILEHQWLAGAPWIAWGLAVGFATLAWGIRGFNLEAALHWAALAFALLAAGVALRFDGPWVIVTVALEGAAVAWIGLRVGRTWFRTAGVIAIAVACLHWLELATSSPPISQALLFNGRAAAGGLIVALVYALALWHRRAGPHTARLFSPLIVAAQILTVAVLTAEASAYWAVGTLSRSDAWLASQLSISLLWAAYAAGLVVIGLQRRYPPVRYVGIGLFALTVAKIFLSDFAFLAGFYRVVGFLVVGAVLVLVAFLYQRSNTRAEAPDHVSV